MNLHPRYLIVKNARIKLGFQVVDLEKEFQLTPPEIVHILLNEAQEYTKYVLRYERHKDYGKKADEE